MLLGLVESMESFGSPRVRVFNCCSIKLQFEPVDELIVDVWIRTRPGRRGHGPRTQLSNNLFPDCRRSAHLRYCVSFKVESRCQQALVVTRNTKTVHQRFLPGTRRELNRRTSLYRSLAVSYRCGAERNEQTQRQRQECVVWAESARWALEWCHRN